MWIIAFNFLFFIIHWRKERTEKINLEILSKMAPNKQEDEIEKRKHSAEKWKNY
jgi:hypothetical protein